MVTELRCKACRRNLYPPKGATGTVELHCPRCGKRQDVDLGKAGSERV